MDEHREECEELDVLQREDEDDAREQAEREAAAFWEGFDRAVSLIRARGVSFLDTLTKDLA